MFHSSSKSMYSPILLLKHTWAQTLDASSGTNDFRKACDLLHWAMSPCKLATCLFKGRVVPRYCSTKPLALSGCVFWPTFRRSKISSSGPFHIREDRGGGGWKKLKNSYQKVSKRYPKGIQKVSKRYPKGSIVLGKNICNQPVSCIEIIQHVLNKELEGLDRGCWDDMNGLLRHLYLSIRPKGGTIASSTCGFCRHKQLLASFMPEMASKYCTALSALLHKRAMSPM